MGRLLDAFSAAGVGRVILVTGYLASRVDEFLAASAWPFQTAVVRNKAFATTNNAASLAAARTLIGSDNFLLCDGDVVFSSSPIPALLASRDQCALVVDRNAALDHEEMKVQLGEDGRVTRISKLLSPAECAGESIGVQKIGGRAVAQLWDTLDRILPRRAADAYYEDAFQQLIDGGVPFGICPIASDAWMEIDDQADLEAARRRFIVR